jgi:NAD(P)-dependent dehydrogenase (short-subunit alcohol dehydrogenase family)
MEDTRVVVTGGAGVLPSAMAEALLKAGATVALWGRGTSHPVEEAVTAVEERARVSGKTVGVTVDTTAEEDVRRALEETERRIGTPTVLINGVGGNKGKTEFVNIDVDTFEEVLRMNLVAGLVVPTKVFASYWIDKGVSASIINLSSMSSYVPLSGVWAYNAAKSAVMNLTVASAKEFAPHGIRVNGIAPGFFLGHQNKALLVKDEAKGELTDRGQQVINRTPYGRFGKYDDIHGVTVFLANEHASGFITGVTVPVDGGFLTDNI